MNHIALLVCVLMSISAFAGKRETRASRKRGSTEISDSSRSSVDVSPASMGSLSLGSSDSSQSLSSMTSSSTPAFDDDDYDVVRQPAQKRAKSTPDSDFDAKAFVGGLDLDDPEVRRELQKVAEKIKRRSELPDEPLTPTKRSFTPISSDDILSSASSKKLKNAIYYISADIKGLYPEKIDLEGELVTEDWLVQRLKRVKPDARIRRPRVSINSLFLRELAGGKIPYYIGRTIQEIQDRKSGHASSANSDPFNRKSDFIQESVDEKSRMRALIHNIHPDQIDVIEAFLIRRYRANLGINLNSTPGSYKEDDDGAIYFYSERYVSPAI